MQTVPDCWACSSSAFRLSFSVCVCLIISWHLVTSLSLASSCCLVWAIIVCRSDFKSSISFLASVICMCCLVSESACCTWPQWHTVLNHLISITELKITTMCVITVLNSHWLTKHSNCTSLTDSSNNLSTSSTIRHTSQDVKMLATLVNSLIKCIHYWLADTMTSKQIPAEFQTDLIWVAAVSVWPLTQPSIAALSLHQRKFFHCIYSPAARTFGPTQTMTRNVF